MSGKDAARTGNGKATDRGSLEEMATIFVDGERYEAKAGQNVLEAVLSQHLDLPYFCWHPAMGSVGACRQCAIVEYADENDERGRLAMACITSVRDGMRISIEAPYAAEFRTSVIEWLMENHPHDCPVCEEGGECHLQDMTVMTGHSQRRYRGTKRTWRNQDLGPFIGHEMNRCITCYRCVRFYRDYAGGTDLDAMGSRGRMYFGRVGDGKLENEFSGNLVEVCPTGVFTDRPFSSQYTRKWDLQSAPSVCPGCAVGCNIFPSERYGDLKRVHNRYHGEINGYFLCDRGRFGSHFVNDPARIRNAGARAGDDVFEARGVDAAVDALGKMLRDRKVIGIGSPRASVESNFALRSLVGRDSFCNGLADAEADLIALALDIHGRGGARIPTLSDVETADAVLVLGEDVLNTAPRVALSMRQAARGRALEMGSEAAIPGWQDAGIRGHAQGRLSPVFLATTLPTRIDDIATATFHATPADIARTGYAVAHRLDGDFAEGDAADEFVERVAAALGEAKRPLVVSGTGSAEPGVIEAAANIAWALRARGADPALLIAPHEANSFGAAMLDAGLSLDGALEAVRSGEADTLVVMENDLYRRAESARVDAALAAGAEVVVMDSMENATGQAANLVLPAAAYAECNGTFVNYEGRAQRFYEVFEPGGEIAPSWVWIQRAAQAAGRSDCAWSGIDDLVRACADGVPALAAMTDAAPAADYRAEADTRIPRQPHRYSGRTAMRADVNVHEPKPTVDDETPFSYSMEGQNTGRQPGSTVPYVWSPGWNSNQSVFKFQQEINGSLSGGDPGARLIGTDGPNGADSACFRNPPAAFAGGDGIRLFPVHAIFGSDELSARSWPVASCSPPPYVVLHPEDARELGVEAGDGVKCDALSATAAVRIDAAVTRGAAACVVGLPGLPEPLPSGPVALSRDPDFPREAEIIAKG